MATFGWSPDFIRKGITGAEGWIYYNWAVENSGGEFGPAWKRSTPGYVKQEFERLKRKKNG